MSDQERIQFGEITLERQEDGWVASGIVRDHGKTAMDALYKLGSMYPLLHVHIAEHFDEVMKQFGPKTDAEKVELLRRVFG